MRRGIAGFLLGCAVAVSVTGCGWMNDDEGFFVNREDDYVNAVPAPPLKVPDRLSDAAIQEVMAVPELPPEAGRHIFADEVPRPEAIYAREQAEGVRIQKLGDRRWLLVPQSPATVWPKVKQFLADNGVRVTAEDGDAGRLDTEWLTPAADSRDVIRLAIRAGRETASVASGRDRLKILVEPGIRERTTEVHVRYENDSLAMPVEDSFPEASDIAEVEAEVIGELGSYIASNVADQSVSFVARQISTQTKAEIYRADNDQPTLRLVLDFNRAWALVNQSLNEAGVPITDVDRTAGVVYAEINDEILQEEKAGWLTRLLTRDSKNQPIEVRMLTSEHFQEVRVVGADGKLLPADVAEQVLLLIREYAT